MDQHVLITVHHAMIPLVITFVMILEVKFVIQTGLEMTALYGVNLEMVLKKATTLARAMALFHAWTIGMVQTVQGFASQEMITMETIHVTAMAQKSVPKIGLNKSVITFVRFQM